MTKKTRRPKDNDDDWDDPTMPQLARIFRAIGLELHFALSPLDGERPPDSEAWTLQAAAEQTALDRLNDEPAYAREPPTLQDSSLEKLDAALDRGPGQVARYREIVIATTACPWCRATTGSVCLRTDGVHENAVVVPYEPLPYLHDDRSAAHFIASHQLS